MINLLKNIYYRNQQNDIDIPKKIKDPVFFCSLCSKKLKFNELIDGYKCSYCENDLFLSVYDISNENLNDFKIIA